MREPPINDAAPGATGASVNDSNVPHDSIDHPTPEGTVPSAWLELGSAREGDAWVTPERNAEGEVIGDAIRPDKGKKVCRPGSKRGLTLKWPLPPYAGSTPDDPVFIVEGASDTAAGVGIGLDIVGRPSATGGKPLLSTLLKDRHVCIIAENDGGAGQRGAVGTADALTGVCASVRIIDPPKGMKDLRAWVHAGATRESILEAAKVAPLHNPNQPAKNGQDSTMTFSPIRATDLIHEYPELRPIVIDGVLRQGEVMNAVAAPKVGKSWLIHDLCVSIVAGRSWLGRPTARGRALLIDAELHRETLAKRLKATQDSLSVSLADMATLEVWSVRGQRLTIDAIGTMLESTEPGTYGLIVLDALYRFMPTDGEENSNETMTRIYNGLDAIAKHTGASIIVVHHATKGSQADKAVTDVGAGAGSQSRAADTHLILRPHEEEDAVVIDAVVRSFPPVNSFVIRSKRPGWALAPDLDPTHIRKPAPRRGKAPDEKAPKPNTRVWEPADFAREIVGTHLLIRDDVIARATQMGLGKTQAESLLRRAIVAKVVHRHTDGPSSPHRFSTTAPESLGSEGEGGGSTSDPAPGASAPGGMGGTARPPSPPSTHANHTDEWGEA